MNTVHKETLRYEEHFLFRKRVHTITPLGIRTQQYGFFNASDRLTSIEKLGGPLIQYQSDLRLTDVIVAITFLVIGIKGLSKSFNDDLLFSISIILIAVAIRWIVGILFSLEYVGSFYFSNGTLKEKDSFEIKSKYPANEKLEAFLHQIRLRQKELAINKLFNATYAYSDFEQLTLEIKKLGILFSMEEAEMDTLIKNIRLQQKELAIHNLLNNIYPNSNLEQLEMQARNLATVFLMEAEEFDLLIKKIRSIYKNQNRRIGI